jgi:hypothetical protein
MRGGGGLRYANEQPRGLPRGIQDRNIEEQRSLPRFPHPLKMKNTGAGRRAVAYTKITLVPLLRRDPCDQPYICFHF